MNEDDFRKTIVQEMEWVRKLLILQTLTAGYKQGQIAAALGVSDATISRMMPKCAAKKTMAKRGAA